MNKLAKTNNYLEPIFKYLDLYLIFNNETKSFFIKKLGYTYPLGISGIYKTYEDADSFAKLNLTDY